MKNLLIFMSLFLVSTNSFCQTIGSMTDERDGKTYKTVTYTDEATGSSTIWMAENLNFEMQGTYAYEDKPKNAKTFGLLYIWDAAMKACPKGWHLATETEWKVLYDKWGGKKKAGAPLKSTKGWINKGQGTNASGFNGLPGGERGPEGEYALNGSDAEFWSATEVDDKQAWWSSTFDYGPGVYYGTFKKAIALSCRCKKD